MPIDIQLKHLVALDLIDDIIIANCYPSAAEKEALKGGKKAEKTKMAEKADAKEKFSETGKKMERLKETESLEDAEKTAVKRVEVRGRTVEELMENLKKLDWTKVPVTE